MTEHHSERQRTKYHCKRCHFEYETGSPKPRCPRCRSRQRTEIIHSHSNHQDDLVGLEGKPMRQHHLGRRNTLPKPTNPLETPLRQLEAHVGGLTLDVENLTTQCSKDRKMLNILTAITVLLIVSVIYLLVR